MKNAVDMVVWGRKTQTSGCSFFDLIWPADTVNNNDLYLLRDWEPETKQAEDYSLNRCTTDLLGFRPSAFKYGIATPGFSNNCGGRGFFVEDVIDKVSPYRPLQIESEDTLGECEPPSKRIKRERYRDVTPEKIQTLIVNPAQQENSCMPQMDTSYCFTATQLEVTNTKRLIERSGNKPDTPYYERRVFNETWKEMCSKYLPKKGSILDNKDVQFWIDIEVSEEKCTFSCFACKFYFEHNFRQDIKHKQEIQTKTGYFHKCMYENQRHIKYHQQQDVHFQAVRFQYEVSKAVSRDEYNLVLQKTLEEEDKLLLPTMRLIKFVYAETLADVPFNKHKLFMETLTSIGVDIGIHQQGTNAAQRIMSMISEDFHKTLLQHLVEQSKPFSLMVDSTTDVSNLPLLICYIQTLEDGFPIVYFYALIVLENGESANATFTSFLQQVKKDDAVLPGFEKFFKQNLIGLSADGASVNVGSERSFHTFTNAYVGRKVPLVACMAHKLQLTINRAIRRQKDDVFSGYFKEFEKSTNSFFVFNMSRGSKRWLHLVETGNLLGVKPRRFKRFLEVRWASSEYEIMKSIVYDYDILKVELLEMNSDSDFALAARNTAMSLYLLLEDKTYSIVLREMLDLLEVYKHMSLALQSTAGILVDKSEIVQKGIESFLELRGTPGLYVTNFLKNCSCPNSCNEGECNVFQFDDCKEVYYNNFVLTDVDNATIKLSKYREKLYDAIIQEIHYDFNLDLLESFEIFNPKKIELPQCKSIRVNPTNENQCINSDDNEISHKYSVNHDKLDRVCAFYSIDKNTCSNFGLEWENVISSMSQRPTMISNFRNEDASQFWPVALTQDLPWTNLTRNMVELVLVTAMTSSDCERGFSYITRLKSKERSSLSTRVLENIVRIKVNGPRKIDNFNAAKYARIFIRDHVRVDDLTAMGGKPSNENSKRTFKESRLF